MKVSVIVCAIFFFKILFRQVTTEPVEDKQALLDFANRVSHKRDLNWMENSCVCNNWIGVSCSADKSKIISVHLPEFGFSGTLPSNTFSRLKHLQILSLRNNSFTGAFPSDFKDLKSLAFLHLQFNKFTGNLPSDFSIWKNLTFLDLSSNNFRGEIPFSISNLTQLSTLNLSNNKFTGEIPDLNLPNLDQLDFSNNALNGTVPRSLERFPLSSFSGNLVSTSIELPNGSNGSGKNSASLILKRSKKLSSATIGGIIVSSIAGLSLLLFLIYANIWIPRKLEMVKKSQNNDDSKTMLAFFDERFDNLEVKDLLQAPVEVIGKGSCGASYKLLLEGTILVVKRLMNVRIEEREFKEKMEIWGKIKHQNVVELKGYCYSKDEQLLIYDFCEHGSIRSMLRGTRGDERIHLNWDTRLGIIVGVARGLEYIHSRNLVHGNIKSSNVFINSSHLGSLSDFNLIGSTRPSDVYGFGLLILELITGKSLTDTFDQDEIIQWINSVPRDKWNEEMLDSELMRYPNIEEELVQLLEIAKACVVAMPEQKPEMSLVVKMIEDVKLSHKVRV